MSVRCQVWLSLLVCLQLCLKRRTSVRLYIYIIFLLRDTRPCVFIDYVQCEYISGYFPMMHDPESGLCFAGSYRFVKGVWLLSGVKHAVQYFLVFRLLMQVSLTV